MPEVTTPTPSVPEVSAPKKPNRAKRKRTMGKVIALTLTAALLLAGGVALYRFLNTSSEEQGEIYTQPAMIGSIRARSRAAEAPRPRNLPPSP